jgi:hypothetical protein
MCGKPGKGETRYKSPCQSHISNIKSFLPVEAKLSRTVGVFLARRSVQHLVYSYGAVIKVERWCIVTHHIFMMNKLIV